MVDAKRQWWPRGRIPPREPRPRLRPAGIGLVRTMITTALGSCFASEVRLWLEEQGYCVFGVGEGGQEPPRPLYNALSIRQEFERAFGRFEPSEPLWRTRIDGEVILLDPYRHNAAFGSEATAEAELREYREKLARMLRQADLVILTIGQAEVWYSRRDGAVYSAIPPADVCDATSDAWRRTTEKENAEALTRCLDLLAIEAPGARTVLTLSPVPLLATFQAKEAVAADMANKRLLRRAIRRAIRERPGRADYFPSFELVRSLGRKAWRPDGRHVSAWGVVQVMQAFERWAA
ncbi:MAG TPA: GSCFA domain-containing protein [Phycisphaerae bacterium]|nr:GSCFA domain-containing protein [Phycisphaerae bacterium]